MSIIPEVRAVKQLKQYYQMIEDAKDSMQKGGGKRKKGGRRHKKLGIKINELEKKINKLGIRITKNLSMIHNVNQYLDDFGADISTNADDIGIIKSFINHKMHQIHTPSGKTVLDKWNNHLNNINRGESPMDQAIMRDRLGINGGRRKTRKRGRKKSKRKKGRKKTKRRRKKK